MIDFGPRMRFMEPPLDGMFAPGTTLLVVTTSANSHATHNAFYSVVAEHARGLLVRFIEWEPNVSQWQYRGALLIPWGQIMGIQWVDVRWWEPAPEGGA